MRQLAILLLSLQISGCAIFPNSNDSEMRLSYLPQTKVTASPSEPRIGDEVTVTLTNQDLIDNKSGFSYRLFVSNISVPKATDLSDVFIPGRMVAELMNAGKSASSSFVISSTMGKPGSEMSVTPGETLYIYLSGSIGENTRQWGAPVASVSIKVADGD